LLTTSPRLGGGSLGSLVETTFHPFGTKKLEGGGGSGRARKCVARFGRSTKMAKMLGHGISWR